MLLAVPRSGWGAGAAQAMSVRARRGGGAAHGFDAMATRPWRPQEADPCRAASCIALWSQVLHTATICAPARGWSEQLDAGIPADSKAL
jgi:hypothetical protein